MQRILIIEVSDTIGNVTGLTTRLQKNPSFPVTFKTLARITGVLLMHQQGNTVYDGTGIQRMCTSICG